MPKGRKGFRDKKVIAPDTVPKDIFEDDVDVSTEEEEEAGDKPQDEQLQESQAATEDSHVPRPESPVLPDLKRARTERKYASLTPSEEVTLVEWYKQHELFYNKRVNAYRDKARKLQLWEDQVSKMGKCVDILEHWIVNMRTRYAKLIDAKSAMHTRKTERDQWIHDSFDFLRPHIVRCPTRTSKVNKVIFKKKSR